MPTANVQIRKILVGRGNTTVSSSYSGVRGEVTMDTGLNTLRVHDGVTVGGTRLATYAELANVSLGNIDLSGYATTAQITAANANAAAQAASINSITANVGAYQTFANANAAAQATALNNINANLGAFQSYANATFGTSSYGNANVKSYLAQFDGNILPSANVTYSLGSSTRQWKDLWVSNATIYLNSVPLGIDQSGNLTFAGNPLVTYANGNLSVGGNNVNINGISAGQVTNGNLILTLSNSTTIDVGTVVGPAGATGAPGAAGATGPQGPQGNTGATGPQGIQGNTGATGAAGPQGIQGNAGPTGPQGIQGNTGAQGSQGIQGPAGATGSQGISVTLVGNVATSGNLPPSGNPGEAYIVTTTGNLFFWNSNVNVWVDIGPIVGPQGDPGPQGPTGATGPQGETGPAGPTGPQGTQGNVGSQGPQGIQGNVGPQGATGATGSQGPAGNTIVGWSVDVNNHLVPNTDNLQDLGTPTSRVRHIYVGPGSITVGNSVITESATGKLVLPGVTRGLNYTIDEVEEKGDQNYAFVTLPVIVDAGHFEILQGLIAPPGGYQPPEYEVDQLDNGDIDGITVVSGGAALDQTVAAKMREFMRAYVGNDPDPITNFNASDWIQIPFTVSTEAADAEYEFGTDLGDFEIDGSVLEAEEATIRTNDGDLTIESDSDVFVKSSGGTHMWEFGTNGRLYLPASGTIEFPDGSIQTTANAGGGGGGNIAGLAAESYSPESEGGRSYVLTVDSEEYFIDITTFRSNTTSPGFSIGAGSNDNNRRSGVVAIGNDDVGYNALTGGVYIGHRAGWNDTESPQGLYAIAIGANAAYEFATNNSITFNATGSELNPDESGLFIKPIREEQYDDAILYYNPVSGEVTYANNAGTSTTATVSNTAPASTTGALWFNLEDGRMYVAASNVWIDASPAVVPGNMVGYDLAGNVTLRDDASINYANGVSILSGIDSTYGDAQVAEFLDAYTGNIAKIGSGTLTVSAVNIELVSDSETWTFNSTGNIVFPDGSEQATAYTGGGGGNTGNVTFTNVTIQGVGNEYGGGGLQLSPDPSLTANLMYFRVRGGDNPTHLHFDTGDGTTYDQYFGDDGKYLKLVAGHDGNVEIGVNTNIGSRNWQFANTGAFIFPDNMLTIGGNIDFLNIPSAAIVAANNQPLYASSSGSDGSLGLLWMQDPVDFLNHATAAMYLHIPNILSGGARISTGVPLVDQWNWDFDAAGNLTIPGNITMSPGSGRLISVVTPEPGLVSWEFGIDGTLTTPGNIITGNVIFADGTVSTGGATYAAANASVQMISNNAYNQVRVDDANVEIYTSLNGITLKQWTFDGAGTVTFPTGGNLVFDSSAVSMIDGVTDINASGTVGANVIQVLGAITSFGASPAPSIYGFSSISTTGSAVNEGNITASGNLVASQNAYVTGNVFAASYNFANGVNILDTISGVTSINSVVSTSILTDVSGDYQYGTLDYSYEVNGNNGQFAIQYSFPLVYGNVDVNVGNVIASNVTTTNGIFWANGQAYSTGGGGSYGNTEVAAYLLTGVNSSLGTLVATNFSTANAIVTGGSLTGVTGAATTWNATNFSTGNIAVTGGYLEGLANVTATGNVTAGNLIGYGSNTTIVAGAYTSVFDNTGLVTVPNITVSGTVDATTVSTDNFTLNESGWTDFTPTVYAGTSAINLGNGFAEGRYRVIGKTVQVWMQVSMGSTTSFGSGEYRISLPVASRMLGSAQLTLVMRDVGTRFYNSLAHNSYSGTGVHTNANVTLFWDTGVVTNSSPFTWADGDFFVISGSYEAN